MRFGQNVLRMTWNECFVQFWWKAHSFPVLRTISGQFDDFKNFDARKCYLAKTCCAWHETSVLYNFHGKCTVSPFWREFQARVTILRTLTLKNAIWPKRAAHDLKRAFCTIFMKSALFSRFEENLRQVEVFWQLWRSKMRFGQNVLRMTWKERFVQFSWKVHCFPFLEKISGPVWRFWQLWRSQMRFGQNVLGMTWKERFVQFSWKAMGFAVLKRILGQCDDFENFDAQKCDLAKTCCAWPETSVLYNFHGKCTVFPFWREFQARVTILRTLTLKNAIWPKRAAHDLKKAFCTIFMKSALFSRFEENLRQV